MTRAYPAVTPLGHVIRITPQEKLPSHGLYIDNVVFFRVLTFYGLFPLHRNESGDFELKWKSWQAIYTMIFVTSGVIFSAVGITAIFKTFSTRSLHFEISVFYASFLCFPVLHVIPILILIRAKMIAEYFNDWTLFIKRLEKLTGKTAPSLNARACLILGSVVLSTTTVFFCQLQASTEEIFHMKGFERKLHTALFYMEIWGVGNVYLNISLLAIVGLGCKRMSAILLQDILEKSWNEKNTLDDHMALWISLRQLCLNFGDVFWMVYCYLIFCMFAVALPVIYLTADSLRYGHVTAFLMACVSVYCIHIMAAIANGASNSIGHQFGKKLSAAMLKRTNNRQLQEFLKDIASCPVAMSLNGFLTLDHSLIVSISSTLITYLVIIMQLRTQK